MTQNLFYYRLVTTILMEQKFTCIFCSKEFINSRSYKNHELRCKLNPNRKIVITEETRRKLSIYGKQTYEKKFGKEKAQEIKNKISISRKKFLLENPDKVPYKLNHYSKGPSYPEQYFIDIIKEEKLPLDYHKCLGLYELDFYNESLKFCLEIDGEQHYVDQRIVDSDIRRNEYLLELGWIIKRIRWSKWQLLDLEKRKDLIQSLKQCLISKEFDNFSNIT